MTSADASAEAHRKLTKKDIEAAAQRLKNWGKWGPDDQLGTLNYTTPEHIISAAGLVRKGKVFSLCINLDERGPQGSSSTFIPQGRFNPIHLMLRTGTDGYSGVFDWRGIRASDDIVIMPLQCGTHWDGLGHNFHGDRMWNGYDIRLVTSRGAEKNGVEHAKEKMVGRGVLLDIARMLGTERLADGFSITNDMLDRAEKECGAKVGRGDNLLIRTGQLEDKLKSGSWDGYCGGDAPGLAFETLDWLHAKQVATVATDTWGVEVRPNPTDEVSQPWHWICIPIMGLTMGETFSLGPLAEDCAADKCYEFMFVAPTLPFTGAVGSPVNPIAIK